MFDFSRGVSAYNNKEFDKAFRLFLKAAEKNDPQAYYMLGRCYHLGRGTSKEYELATRWYTRALSGGHNQAQQAIETVAAEKQAVLQKEAEKKAALQREAEKKAVIRTQIRKEAALRRRAESLRKTQENHYKGLLQSIRDNNTLELGLLTTSHPDKHPFDITPLQAWEGYTSYTNALAVLPDGSLVSGSDDTCLWRWDLQSGRCLSVWEGHTGTVTALAVLPNGSLVSGSYDKTLRHWDTQSGQCLSVWEGHTNSVNALAVLPDGSLVSASGGNSLRRWDTRSGQCLAIWEEHDTEVNTLAVLPDGSLVSGNRDRTLRHWDPQSGRCTSTWKGHTNSVYALAVLPDGSLVSGGADNSLRRWDTQSGQCLSVWEGHTYYVQALGVLHDGTVVSGGFDRTLRHWDPQSGQCLSVWKGHTSHVYALAVLTDGSVVSGSRDKTFRHWPRPGNLLSLQQVGEALKALQSNGSVRSLTLSGATFTPAMIQALAQVIANHPHLNSLTLEHCDLTDKSVQPLLQALKNPDSKVTQLTLSHNPQLSQNAQNALQQAMISRSASTPLAEEDQWVAAAQGAPANAEPVAPTLPATPSPRPSAALVSPAGRQQSTPVVPPGAPVMDVSTGGIHLSFEIGPEELTYEMQLNPRTQVEEPVCLGQGGFGVVYKGTWRHQPVAVKALTSQGLTDSAREEFINEVQVMVNLRVPQVVALYGISVQPRYQLVMEYCPHGSLFGYLHSSQPMDWGMRGRIALEVAQGLAFLHACQPPILHRDLKSQNILLDRNYSAKLADFGLSRLKQESRSSTSSQKDSVGTVAWMAPELFKRRARYVKGSDMYSYGMILWELSSRSMPWSDAHSNALIIQWVSQGDREDIPSSTPLPIATLIKACWEADPDKRPSAEEAMKTLAQSLGGLGQVSASGPGLGQGAYQGAFTSAGASATPATGIPSVANPAVPSYISGYQGIGSHTASGGGYAGQSGTFFSQGGSGASSSPTSGYQGAAAYSGYQPPRRHPAT